MYSLYTRKPHRRISKTIYEHPRLLHDNQGVIPLKEKEITKIAIKKHKSRMSVIKFLLMWGITLGISYLLLLPFLNWLSSTY